MESANRVLVIDRETWGRGNPGESKLLNVVTGKFCCLGFYALQLAGATEAQIEGQSTPTNFRVCPLPWGDDLVSRDPDSNSYEVSDSLTPLCCELIGVNDSPSFSDSSRELSITQLFAKMNVRVEFVG